MKDFLKILFIQDLPTIHAYSIPIFFSLGRELKPFGVEVAFSDYRRLAWLNNNGISFSKVYLDYKDNKINLNIISILTPLLYNNFFINTTYKLEEKNLEKYILRNKIDIIFTHKYFKPIIKIIKKYKIKLILFSGDEDFSKEWFDFARESDIVFCASEYGFKIHKEKGIRSEILRFAVDDKIFKPLSKKEILDFVFIGKNWCDRENKFSKMILPLIKKYGKKVHLFGFGWEKFKDICCVHEPVFWYLQPLIYSCSKISLNVHRFSYIVNYRTFETLACKTFLLSDYTNELGKLFENKKDMVMVNDEKEIIELAQYYLDNEEEREKIATRGYEKVIKNHTFKHRAKQVYDAIRLL
jgi:glycosyltransferase involved in cell wall biosynthesis